MKSGSIKNIIIVVLLGIVAYLAFYNNIRQNINRDGDGISDKDDYPFEYPGENYDKDEPILPPDLEAKSQNFVMSYETEALENALTIDEVKQALTAIPAYANLSSKEKCAAVLAAYKKNSCKPRRKYLKTLATKIGSGAVALNGDKIEFTSPMIVKFKEQVNQINYLMELSYMLRQGYCDRITFCSGIVLMWCEEDNRPKELNDAFAKCTVAIVENVETRLIEVTQNFLKSLESLGKGNVTEESIKAVANADLASIKKDMDNGPQEENTEEKDSIISSL